MVIKYVFMRSFKDSETLGLPIHIPQNQNPISSTTTSLHIEDMCVIDSQISYVCVGYKYSQVLFPHI